MNNYRIINAYTLQKRIDELEKRENEVFDSSIKYKPQIDILKEILSQSTPLIPEIEKAFNAGIFVGEQKGSLDIRMFKKNDYIQNLKIDI